MHLDGNVAHTQVQNWTLLVFLLIAMTSFMFKPSNANQKVIEMFTRTTRSWIVIVQYQPSVRMTPYHLHVSVLVSQCQQQCWDPCVTEVLPLRFTGTSPCLLLTVVCHFFQWCLLDCCCDADVLLALGCYVYILCSCHAALMCHLPVVASVRARKNCHM